MTPDEMLTKIRSSDFDPREAFGLLKHLTIYLARDQEDICRELLLRILDKEECFQNLLEPLQAIVRELGLFPYLRAEDVSFSEALAYEYHRPDSIGDDIVFHREQWNIYKKLLAGNSIILSAPTSFGKIKIIDGVIAHRTHRNIVIIVPTIALIDETRRGLSKFRGSYKLVTQVSQEPSSDNIFIFTAERANAYAHFPQIDFFAIDEFYKIDPAEDNRRSIELNICFYRLVRSGAQFYLLGPNVERIPDGLESKYKCKFYTTKFSTVTADEFRASNRQSSQTALIEIVRSLEKEPTLIFCQSPRRTNEVARWLIEAEATAPTPQNEDASNWVANSFHPEWTLRLALLRGIGLHHGKLPRSLSQHLVRLFNEGRINTLVCTSTLIEGVNTKAKNIIIFDNKIANKPIDYFTFNNIKGRAGRMFQHFVGKIYLFQDPPITELPYVDFPVFTQGLGTPSGILLNVDPSDLSAESTEAISNLTDQDILPLDLLKRHSSVSPERLILLAEYLGRITRREAELLGWMGIPKWENLKATCEIIWDILVEENQRAGVHSGSQLATKTMQVGSKKSARQRILDELGPGEYAAKSPDEAVERVLEFDRTWASFELPRLLRAFSDVQERILPEPGKYLFYAALIEHLFRRPYQVALEEFGLPIQVSDKLERFLTEGSTIDETLKFVKSADPSLLGLDEFEVELFVDCQTHA